MQNANIHEFSQQVLFITDVERIIGRKRLTLRRWWVDGKFPQPAKLNGTTLVWRSDVIFEWVDRNTRVAGTRVDHE